VTHPGIDLAGDVPVSAGAEETDRLGELLDADDAGILGAGDEVDRKIRFRDIPSLR
jgi:hypothetical protein